MKNVKRDENSPVETIDERLKRFHTNEIGGRERLRLRKEKGWEGGKTKATWGRMKRIPLRKLRIDLTNVEMIGST